MKMELQYCAIDGFINANLQLNLDELVEIKMARNTDQMSQVIKKIQDAISDPIIKQI